MATKTKAVRKATTDPATKLMKAAEVLVNPDPNAIKLAYDPKAKRPFLLACVTCQKPIRRSDNAPGHTCFSCDQAAAHSAKAPKGVAQPAEAKTVEPVKATPKTRKSSSNPRVLANRMVMARAKAIADRSQADA